MRLSALQALWMALDAVPADPDHRTIDVAASFLTDLCIIGGWSVQGPELAGGVRFTVEREYEAAHVVRWPSELVVAAFPWEDGDDDQFVEAQYIAARREAFRRTLEAAG